MNERSYVPMLVRQVWLTRFLVLVIFPLGNWINVERAAPAKSLFDDPNIYQAILHNPNITHTRASEAQRTWFWNKSRLYL